MNKIEYEDGYIHMYAIVACHTCDEAFDTCDAVIYPESFDGEELRADCPYCEQAVYVEAYSGEY